MREDAELLGQMQRMLVIAPIARDRRQDLQCENSVARIAAPSDGGQHLVEMGLRPIQIASIAGHQCQTEVRLAHAPNIVTLAKARHRLGEQSPRAMSVSTLDRNPAKGFQREGDPVFVERSR